MPLYNVTLIPQTTALSCWAASIAMILGWRDQASYDPSLIAANHGGISYMPSFHGGLDPNDRYILRRNGFAMDPPQCYMPGSIGSLLDEHGPLWVAGAMPYPHIRVVTGMQGNMIHVNDPEPVNSGSTYTRSFEQFFGRMESLGGRELTEPDPVYVAYLAERLA